MGRVLGAANGELTLVLVEGDGKFQSLLKHLSRDRKIDLEL